MMNRNEVVEEEEENDRKVINDLCKWMKSNEFDIESISQIKLKASDKPYEGRCVFAVKDFKANDIIVEIPLPFLINYRLALLSTPHLRNFFEWSATTSNKLNRLDALYLYLLDEYGDCTSHLYNFVKSMPKTYDTPEYFQTNLVDLLPNYIRVIVLKRIEKLKLKYETILNLLNAYNNKNSDAKLVRLAANFTFERLKWIFSCVNTRCFYLDENEVFSEEEISYANKLFGKLNRNLKSQRQLNQEETEEVNNCLCCLVPYLDFMNHSNEPNSNAFFDEFKKCYVLQVLDTDESKLDEELILIKSNDQIYVQYGPHDNMNLFIEYGFIIENNSYDCFKFQLNDFIELLTDKTKSETLSNLQSKNSYSNDLTANLELGPSWSVLKSLELVIDLNNELWKSPKKNNNKKTKLNNSSMNSDRCNASKIMYEKILNKYLSQLTKALKNLNNLEIVVSNSYHLNLCRNFLNLQLNIIKKNFEIASNNELWESLF